MPLVDADGGQDEYDRQTTAVPDAGAGVRVAL
jgi:hypothetical protein